MKQSTYLSVGNYGLINLLNEVVGYKLTTLILEHPINHLLPSNLPYLIQSWTPLSLPSFKMTKRGGGQILVQKQHLDILKN